MAGLAALGRRAIAAIAFPDVRRVGTRAAADLQRSLHDDSRRQAPGLAWRTPAGGMGRGLGRGRLAAGRYGDVRDRDLSRERAGDRVSGRLRRADLGHLLLFAGP